MVKYVRVVYVALNIGIDNMCVQHYHLVKHALMVHVCVIYMQN